MRSQVSNNVWLNTSVESNMLNRSADDQQTVGTLEQICVTIPENRVTSLFRLAVSDKVAFDRLCLRKRRNTNDLDRTAPSSRGNHNDADILGM